MAVLAELGLELPEEVSAGVREVRRVVDE